MQFIQLSSYSYIVSDTVTCIRWLYVLLLCRYIAMCPLYWCGLEIISYYKLDCLYIGIVGLHMGHKKTAMKYCAICCLHWEMKKLQWVTNIHHAYSKHDDIRSYHLLLLTNCNNTIVFIVSYIYVTLHIQTGIYLRVSDVISKRRTPK